MKDGSTNPGENSILKELLLELKDRLWVRILEVSLDQLSIGSDYIEGSEETLDTTLSEAVVLLK